MEKYNKKTILDYINGNDIANFDVDDLENDKEFMMQVIKISNDCNFYNLCSEDLKKDYEFIKYLILKFKNNISFICFVADYYLETSKDEFSEIELNILMSNLTTSDKIRNLKYNASADSRYLLKRVQIEMAKKELNDSFTSQEIGMGFLLMFDSFNGSEIILNYYAQRTIGEIFNEYNLNLESILHKQFKDPHQIDKIGINNYLLNFLGSYDSMLSSYISTHLDLLNPLKQEIKIINENWIKNTLLEERKKYNMLFEKVHEYMETTPDEFFIGEIDIIYFIGKKLGILDKLVKYYGISQEVSDIIISELDEPFLEEHLMSNSQDRFYYNAIMKIMLSTLANDNSNSSKDKTGKVLRINFKKD